MAYLRDNVESQRIHTYLSFHSAVQKLLFPYAAISAKPPNNNDLKRIGEKASKAFRNRCGTPFQAGSAYHILYEAAGTSLDWVYSALNVPIVYAYELRRPREMKHIFEGFQFLLPADEIEAAGWETLDSVVALLNEAETLGYYKVNSTSDWSFVEETTTNYDVISYCKLNTQYFKHV